MDDDKELDNILAKLKDMAAYALNDNEDGAFILHNRLDATKQSLEAWAAKQAEAKAVEARIDEVKRARDNNQARINSKYVWARVDELKARLSTLRQGEQK